MPEPCSRNDKFNDLPIRSPFVVGVDLSGTRLGNDLFFVMHDNATGRMRLHARLTDLGLAAAILGELMLAGRITVGLVAGQVQLVVLDEAPPGDRVAGTALEHIVAEPSHRFRTWLHFLARTALADVAARMVDDGLLRPPGRRPSRKRVPVDVNVAGWPAGRVNLAIQRREPLNVQDSVLLGLLVATGGNRLVLWEQNPGYLSDAIAALPAPLQELIAQTEAAVGDAVISRR
ncbi:GPP34 family phosphoprotein [Streptosporangium sp. NPDC000563]|uniref:GOLPH3/VPS74 family protein n=1 Tax=unclassified Streptosporangium TaxID=2632669 RepID=UPI003317AFC2